ncbi:MAG TPA: GntR family transcriptional regulator [Solirubrobacterales bacterium]|nr:GntR family transcriptional regulator [Solirubrobacterales bacterium]
MPRLSKTLLNDGVVEVLRSRIYDGHYPPGTPLRQEELAEELGVSRTPLREAFRTLRREGLIEESSQGVKVISLDLEAVIQAYRLREVLDGLVTRLAAERRPPGLREELERFVDMQEAGIAADEMQAYTEANVGFHLALWNASDNEFVLTECHILRMTAQLFVPRAVVPPQVASVAVQSHREIIEAVAAGDGDRSESLARDHIRRSIDALGRQVTQSKTPEGSRE